MRLLEDNIYDYPTGEVLCERADLKIRAG